MHTYCRFPLLYSFISGATQKALRAGNGETKSTKPDEMLAASAQARMKWKVVGNHLQGSKSNCPGIMDSYYFDRCGFDKSF